jgi:hypothetical protein
MDTMPSNTSQHSVGAMDVLRSWGIRGLPWLNGLLPLKDHHT